MFSYQEFLRILCLVKATSKSLAPKNSNSSGSTSPAPPDLETALPQPDEYVHDYTDCCKSSNVSEKCQGFCTIHNIIDGTAGIEPDACETDFPKIVKCNHKSKPFPQQTKIVQ